jgi:predicted nucleic acid-binding protein
VTVVDASVVVAALVDNGPDGQWAADLLAEPSAFAPHLMPVEVTQIIRRLVHAGSVSADVAALALEDLSDLAIPLHEFGPYADRVWELRDTVTTYDAWYVALAESFDVPLATLDGKLAKAPGPRCEFRTPVGAG